MPHRESSILGIYLMSQYWQVRFPITFLISINNQGLESEFILFEEQNTGYESNIGKETIIFRKVSTVKRARTTFRKKNI